MTTCTLYEPCVSEVMTMIEVDPEPFILVPDPLLACDTKLCNIVAMVGEEQGPPMPPLEYLIGREELLAFIFNGSTIPPAAVPLPPTILLMILTLGFLWVFSIVQKRRGVCA